VGELIKANPQVKDPNKIFPGQRLNLPASWMTKPVAPTAPPPLTTNASPNANPSPMPVFPAPVLASAAASVMPTISQQAKSSGAAVTAWQNILIRDGFAAQGTADGFFGPNTTTRTKAWQQKHGLGADGVVGPNTWKIALATIPTVLTPSATPSPSAAPTPSIATPLGNLPIPAIFQPTMATISENPLAQQIGLSPVSTPLPALPPALSPPISTAMATIPPVGTVLGQTPVTATQTGPSEVTVTQPPIGGDVPSSGKPGLGGIGAVALALGALYVVGKGKLGL
jgi:peptidoglycan hydrolase-like protein with peptidoglycan-binding domain